MVQPDDPRPWTKTHEPHVLPMSSNLKVSSIIDRKIRMRYFSASLIFKTRINLRPMTIFVFINIMQLLLELVDDRSTDLE